MHYITSFLNLTFKQWFQVNRFQKLKTFLETQITLKSNFSLVVLNFKPKGSIKNWWRVRTKDQNYEMVAFVCNIINGVVLNHSTRR